MWSEDPGKKQQAREEEEPRRETRPAEQVSESGPLRWLWVFDGWRLDAGEDEFVLA